ncbi:hypothetical protein ACQPUR_16945 [Clostridium neonatale]
MIILLFILLGSIITLSVLSLCKLSKEKDKTAEELFNKYKDKKEKKIII